MATHDPVRQWEQELLERGRMEGREEGRNETRRALMVLLRARFGTIEAAVEQRVSTAPLDELLRWLERAATEPSVADVLDG